MTVDQLLAENVITPTLTYVEFHPYEMVYFENHDLICADIKGEEYRKKPFDIIECIETTKCGTLKTIQTNNISILIMLIRLAESIPVEDGKRKISLKSIRSICEKYGFPITNKMYTEEYGYIIGTFTNQFAERLDQLYLNYAMWKAVQLEDLSTITQVWPRPLSEAEMKELLKKYNDHHMRLALTYKDDQPMILYQVDDLFTLAEAQLLFLIGMGANDMGGAKIARCKYCGDNYVKTRKNAFLCDRCKGNTEKVRRYRAKKKGDQNNG